MASVGIGLHSIVSAASLQSVMKEFIDTTRNTILSRNYEELDNMIQKKLPQYLYNCGDGREKSLKEMSPEIYEKYSPYLKQRYVVKKKFVTQSSKDSAKKSVVSQIAAPTSEICWREDKRGDNGETLLHLCLDNGGRIHRELAMRLLKFYPKLAIDIYLGEKYYGKSCLHLAIGNEDTAMVRILLRSGADVNARWLGVEATQKKSRSAKTADKVTNYGYLRAHEYPLSLAATFNLDDCCRWILLKGGDASAQDIYGNTILHVLVYEDNLDMFDKIYKMCKCNTSIKNNKGFTPLTLAAKKARKTIFNYILDTSSQRQWKYNTVVCDAYPLAEVDTVVVTDVGEETMKMSTLRRSLHELRNINPKERHRGKLNKHSALELIVHGKRTEHLNLLDGLMYEILMEKWKAFGGTRFALAFIMFNIYYAILLTAFILRPSIPSWTEFEGNQTECYLLEMNTSKDMVRVVFECIILVWALYYLVTRIIDALLIGLRAYIMAQVTLFPSKAVFSVSLFLILLATPFRFTCLPNAENNIIVLAVLFTGPYELFFCRGMKFLGPFVIMIYNMLLGDVLRFVIIYSIFIIGFSQSMYILFLTHTTSPDDQPVLFVSGWDSMFGMFIISLSEFEEIYVTFDYTSNPLLAKMVFLVFTILAMILLVNLLIAMMGNTYAKISETKKEWLRQWAIVVLDIERGMTEKQRYNALLSYSQPTDANLPDRSFIVRRRL